MTQKSEEPIKASYAPLPPPGLPVQIQCEGFRCLAFRDKEGKWVDFFTRENITDFRGVLPRMPAA